MRQGSAGSAARAAPARCRAGALQDRAGRTAWRWLLCLVVIGALLLPQDGWGQQPEAPTLPPGKDSPERTDQPETTPAPSQPPQPPPPPGTVLVAGFTLSGNLAVGTWELAPVLQPFVGQALSLSGLEGVADLITQEYRRRGYTLARAYIPEQTIRAGIVEIGVLEGRAGRLDVTGNTHYSTTYIRRYFAKVFEEGAIKYGSLERALLLLNDNPDLNVSALLQPGEVVGFTDITAKAQDKRPIHLSANVNNFGQPTVSRERYTVGADVGNALFDGALLSANLILGNDPRTLFFQFGAYSVPINGQGTRLVVSASNGRFDVGGALAFLKIAGKSRSYDVSITHPLLRTRVDSLYLETGFTSKDNRLFILDSLLGTDALRMLKLGVSYDRQDGTGRTFLSLYGYQGLGKFLGGMADNAPQATRLGADNRFTKAAVAASRVQSVWENVYLIVRGTGQISTGILPILEEVLLGGADSVRGYSLGERQGDEGYTISAEARLPVPYVKVAQFVLFIDNGAVRIRGNLVGQQSYYSLTGAGPGLRVGLPYYEATLRLDLGFPLEPPKALTGSLSGGSSPTLYFMLSTRL